MSIQEAFIVSGLRTAIGKAKKGGFRFTRADDLGTQIVNKLLSQIPQLDVKRIDDIIVGNAVPEAEQGLQIARWIAVQANLVHVPAVTVNRYCASGLEAIAMATAKIRSGMADCIIAGGAESMSLVPTVGYKTVPNYNVAKDHAEYFLGMGLTAEEVAKEYHITREDADLFSMQSHQKAVKAISEGRFKDEILPITIEEILVENGKRKTKSFTVDTDEGPRAGTTLEALAKLKPAFKQGGQVTAGNSSQTSDGAAFTIVMSEKMMNELGLKPMARIVSCTSAGVNPRLMGIGPVEAVPRALKQAGIKLDDMDVIELNEAFATQSLAVIRTLGMDPEKVNPNGGAIALGHPLGCTGAILTLKARNELVRKNKKYGLITACVGGGQGIAGVIEALN
jgi:acetyl-CoA acyltransferase